MLDLPPGSDARELAGRSMIVNKCRVAPVECVVRGYLEGSGWKEYQASGAVCGIRVARRAWCNARSCRSRSFTPATKEESGHDQNISFEQMAKIVGDQTAAELRRRSIDIYMRANEHANGRGIIIADTKFEWGWDGR